MVETQRKTETTGNHSQLPPFKPVGLAHNLFFPGVTLSLAVATPSLIRAAPGSWFSPRWEPLCSPTHLTPTSLGLQTPREPVRAPPTPAGSEDPGSQSHTRWSTTGWTCSHSWSPRYWPGLGALVEATGEKMPDSTYTQETLQGHFLPTMLGIIQLPQNLPGQQPQHHCKAFS